MYKAISTSVISTKRKLSGNYDSVQYIPAGNPNPARYKITSLQKIGKFIIVGINYPDCKNYEGDKILLYHNVTEEQINSANFIDPHFTNDEKHISPIARFEPTEDGWQMAVILCEKLTE